jgi:hypothetical protein
MMIWRAWGLKNDIIRNKGWVFSVIHSHFSAELIGKHLSRLSQAGRATIQKGKQPVYSGGNVEVWQMKQHTEIRGSWKKHDQGWIKLNTECPLLKPPSREVWGWLQGIIREMWWPQ